MTSGHPAIVRAHSCAMVMSVAPGKNRRSSTAEGAVEHDGTIDGSGNPVAADLEPAPAQPVAAPIIDANPATA